MWMSNDDAERRSYWVLYTRLHHRHNQCPAACTRFDLPEINAKTMIYVNIGPSIVSGGYIKHDL